MTHFLQFGRKLMQISKNMQLDFEKKGHKSGINEIHLNKSKNTKKIQFNHFSTRLHFTDLLITPKEHLYKRIASQYQ